MNQKNLLLSIVILSFFSCSPKGFQSQQTSLDKTTSDNLSDSFGNPVGPEPLNINDIDLKGQVDGNFTSMDVQGSQVIDFDKMTGHFIVMIPMPRGLIFTPNGAFANYQDITFSPIFDATGKMKLAVRIPITYIIKGSVVENPSKLPSGEKLPKMPAGKDELPSFALQFPEHNKMQLHLYIGINALGVFMTLPDEASLPFPIPNITLPIKNKAKTLTKGYLTYVSAKRGYPSGLFLATIIPSGVARVLEDYFHL